VESIYHKIAELENSSREAALCIVIDTKGSAPRKTGAKMLVLSNGSIHGSIGGGALEMKVIQDAIGVISSKMPSTFKHQLVHDHGMCCGGTVEIFIEPIVNRKKLYIFGAGHIGKSLAIFAEKLDFNVSLIDERDNSFSGVEQNGIALHLAKHKKILKELQFDTNTFIAVVTHNHAYDREIVEYCAKQPHAYLGMIGSERKVEIAKKTFKAGNKLNDKEMKGIDWPMGIQINAQTPGEIAVSILAKMINVRATITK